MNPCTTDICQSWTGCVHMAIVCNDDNLCTNDTCNPLTGNCTFADIPVPAGDYCIGILCDPKIGIVKTPTPCPSACEAACDPLSGCQKCPGDRFTAEIKIAVGVGAGAIAGNCFDLCF